MLNKLQRRIFFILSESPIEYKSPPYVAEKYGAKTPSEIMKFYIEMRDMKEKNYLESGYFKDGFEGVTEKRYRIKKEIPRTN